MWNKREMRVLAHLSENLQKYFETMAQKILIFAFLRFGPHFSEDTFIATFWALKA